jgi:murein DD-endopeptidase MepM/ murein hydrolase activator NlpD
LSRRTAQHRKTTRSSPARVSLTARHRKPTLITSALQNKPARFAAAVAGSILAVSAGPAAVHWAGDTSRLTSPGQAHALDALGAAALRRGDGTARPAASPPTGGSTSAVPPLGFSGRDGGPPLPSPASERALAGRTAAQHQRSQRQAASRPVYRNPFRDIGGLIPERIDMGVDFGGSGPVYALGDAVITSATANSAGWPGGGWITYRLTDGPDAGLMVFVAEDVTPAVQAGQHVSSATVIATMFDGGDGIETGWAMPDGFSAESQLPVAGGISGGGPFPTMIGLNFEELLQSLGTPAANNRTDPTYGVLPANYPTSWT